MRSEISHVHPGIRTQIPDEITDCNQVSFSAPFADNHYKYRFSALDRCGAMSC